MFVDRGILGADLPIAAARNLELAHACALRRVPSEVAHEEVGNGVVTFCLHDCPPRLARRMAGLDGVLRVPPEETLAEWWRLVRRLVVVALGTALRRGELLALRWQDVAMLEGA